MMFYLLNQRFLFVLNFFILNFFEYLLDSRIKIDFYIVFLSQESSRVPTSRDCDRDRYLIS